MKKFFISLLVCSCFLLLLFGSVSFASVDYSKFNEINYTGTQDELINQMFEFCFNCDYEYFKQQPHGNTTSNFTTYESYLNNIDYISYYFYTENNSNNTGSGANTLYIYFSKNVNWTGSNSCKGFYFYIPKSSGNYVCQVTSNTSGLSVSGNLTTSSANKVLYTDKWYVAKNQNFMPANPTISFIPLSTTTKTIDNILFYIQNFTRYETNFKIGQLQNFDLTKSYRGICAMLVNGVYQNSNISLYINPTGEVFVYTANLLFNQGYGFKFFNGDLETDIYNFYFIPKGTSSGDIPSGDYVYNGFDNNDIVPIVNVVASQYEVNSGEMGAYIDNTLFPSGDLSTIASYYNFDSFENQYFNYIYGFFTNIINTLSQERGRYSSYIL